MNEKILFVDDDPYILSAIRRQLHRQFNVLTAEGAEPALELIRKREEFAVVVSDLRMPGMDGIQFLSRVHEYAPDTVRVMLTGHADIEAAIAAVNESNIFRFLTKPANQETLVKVLDASIQQYRLITAERELLQNTLNGSVRVLVDILSFASTAMFDRASRTSERVHRIATQLMVPNVWQFELAALLSQIGCILLPPSILTKLQDGTPLTEEEQSIFATHPETARDLLMRVPRMESIAQMIAGQLEPFKWGATPQQGAVRLGASMLKVALDYDARLKQGMTHMEAIAYLQSKPEDYDPLIVNTLAEI